MTKDIEQESKERYLMNFKRLDICVVCGGLLKEYLDMGEIPLANNLKENPSEEDVKYPLFVNECIVCTHKQLSVAVEPDILFSNYLYQTGTSQSHLEFFKRITKVISLRGVGSVLDIGCNDGSLLRCFKDLGWEVMGIEPCKNFKYDEGITVLNGYFPRKFDRNFDVITAFNVFAHNSDPRDFLRHMANLLKPNGMIFIITTPASLFNFYHEHISYFTPMSMSILANECELDIDSIVTSPMHGKSYLFELSRKKDVIIQSKDTLNNLTYPAVGYGASAGATVLLNYYGLNLEYIVDDSPTKQGKYVPGVNIPICDSKRLELDPRNLTIVITAFNLFEELKNKITKLRPNAKDTFINPLKGVL